MIDQPVYATRTGRAFHAKPDCRALVGGQLMNDDLKVFWLGRNKGRRLHGAEPMPLPAAFGRGKDPCAVCFPLLRRALVHGNYENDFGHEPFGPYDGVLICARCYTTATRCSIDAFDNPHRLRVRETVPWPCTSAIILGLADRVVEVAP